MDWDRVLSIAVISLLGAMSPGPDFAVVMKNCLIGTFRTGVLTAVGIASALLVHISYCILGIALLIAQSPIIFNIVKYLGAAYLFYLGVVLLKQKITSQSIQAEVKAQHPKIHRPFLSGFLCNMLNPKATLFILGLFTQFITPQMTFWDKAVLGSTVVVMAFFWFTILSFLLTHHLIQKQMVRFERIITRVMGAALALLSIYVAFFT